jgi:cyclopropane-fatty-acyl-phospholipid synthase
MSFSGAWFSHDGMTLEEAQIAKYERLCTQLHLRSNDHVLEIGTGWGSNAIHMTRQSGCRVTTLTTSKEQYEFATERIKAAGLDSHITVLFEDYHSLKGSFDNIVSIEMLEATDNRCFETWFTKCQQWLKRGGTLALQVITGADSSMLPSLETIKTTVNRIGGMTPTDCKDLGFHYAATLKIWFMQFNSRLAEIRAMGFDDRFIYKWNYYLNHCEAAFRMRDLQATQMAYSRS